MAWKSTCPRPQANVGSTAWLSTERAVLQPAPHPSQKGTGCLHLRGPIFTALVAGVETGFCRSGQQPAPSYLSATLTLAPQSLGPLGTECARLWLALGSWLSCRRDPMPS